MKRLITIIFALIGFYSFGQVNYVGSATTAQIDGLNIPSGRSALIYNSTLSQYGFENSASLWYWLITEADIDTFSKLDAIVADKSLANLNDAQTFSATQTFNGQVILGSVGARINNNTANDYWVQGTVANQAPKYAFFGYDEGILTSQYYLNMSGNPVDATDLIDKAYSDSGTQTLTNKTIDATANTISNIGSAEITDGSIAEADIANGAVTTGKILAGAVTTTEIADGGIYTNDIASGTIDETNLDASVNASLDLADSAVQGPVSSTDNTIPRFDSTTGKLLQGSGVTIDDTNNMDQVNDIVMTGNLWPGNVKSNTSLTNELDDNNNTANATFDILNGTDATVFTVDESGNITATGDLTVTGGDINSATSLDINLDTDNNGTESFNIVDGAGTPVFTVNESGNITTVGTIVYDNTISGLTATDVKTAIDELESTTSSNTTNITTNAANIATNASDIADIETTLATVQTTAMSFSSVSTNYTLAAADAKDNAIIDANLADEAITVPSGVFAQGNTIRIKQAQAATDSVRVLEGTGVSILGYTDGFSLSGYPAQVLIGRTTADTSPETWEILDYNGAITDYTIPPSCTPDVNEQHTAANAASDPNCNEANATTGWTTNNVSLSVESSDVDTGTYALKITTTAATGYAQYNVSVTAGDQLAVSFRVKAVTDAGGTSARDMTNRTAVTGSAYATPLPSTWSTVTYTIQATATGTCSLRIYPGVSDTVGNIVLIDNLSIIKT